MAHLLVISSCLDTYGTLANSVEHFPRSGIKILGNPMSEVQTNETGCSNDYSIKWAVVRIQLSKSGRNVAANVLYSQMRMLERDLGCAANRGGSDHCTSRQVRHLTVRSPSFKD
jgi:hypothetical protein